MKEGDKIRIKAHISLPNFCNYTFLMPSVSVGNVGQLAVDVIIATLQPTKAAIVDHPALLPLVGYDPYDSRSSSIVTAADLHLYEPQKLIILQMRSPLILEEKKSFLEGLTHWIRDNCFNNVIILSSCHARLRHDSQLTGLQFRYLANGLKHPKLDQLNHLGVTEMEEREDFSGINNQSLGGEGFVSEFLDLCEIPTIVLMKFVDEGDNTNDALALVSLLNAWTKYKEEDKWKVPFSWKNLFGAPPPPLLY